MNLRILSVSADPLQACAVFPYRGHVVSASTVFAPNVSVVIYASEEDSKRGVECGEFHTVEAAIAAIDARVDGRPVVQTRCAADRWEDLQAAKSAPTTDADREWQQAALQGRTIEAVKACRALHGYSLTEARHVVGAFVAGAGEGAEVGTG